MHSELLGVSSVDPVTLVAVLAATSVPARRAAAIERLEALRCE